MRLFFIKISVYMILFSYFVMTNFVSGQDIGKKIELGGLTINIAINSGSHADSISGAKLNPVIHNNGLTEKFFEYLAGYSNNLGALKNDLSSYLKQHKYSITFGVLATSYGYTYYRLNKMQKFMYSKELWSNWKSDLLLHQLLSLPQQELALELYKDIQKRYTSENFINYMSLFMFDIDKEVYEINKFISWVKTIKFLRLTKIHTISDNALIDAQERINRLSYLKNIFSSLVTEFKIK